MSVTSLSYGGVGVVLWMNDDMTWPTLRRESCDHSERIGHAFCPVCGTKVETRVKEQGARDAFVEAFENTNPDTSHFIAVKFYYDERPDGYDPWRDRDKPKPPGNDGVFIGYGGAAGGYGDKIFKSLPLPPADVEEQLRAWEAAAYAWLKSHGYEPPNSIFDSRKLGLHIIDYFN